jgi:hypothetical protein
LTPKIASAGAAMSRTLVTPPISICCADAGIVTRSKSGACLNHAPGFG